MARKSLVRTWFLLRLKASLAESGYDWGEAHR